MIPSADSHFGEYVQERFKVCEYMSGFTGSAGTLVVTQESAALWTDSRYFVQAVQQLNGSGVELMKLKDAGTPSIEQWLVSQLESGEKVGIDGSLFSLEKFQMMKRECGKLNVVLVDDFFDEIWDKRPLFKSKKVRIVPNEISGATSGEKLKKLNSLLKIKGRYYYILSSCDDVAWLCNIRGADIEYNPLAYSYAVFDNNSIHLFISPESVDEEIILLLKDNGIEVHDYNSFLLFLNSMDPGIQRCFCESNISVKNYKALHCNPGNIVKDVIPGGVTAFVKARKNNVEIDGFRKAMINDGVAWVKLIKYLEDSFISSSDDLYEHSVAEKLIEFRRENLDYLGESFAPIVAYGKNAALPHYSFTNTVKVMKKGLLLVDSGAHYPYGTTDTTRTIVCGEITEEQKRDFTFVLKGMINLSRAVFIPGTRGSSLDILARGEVMRGGKVYMHGTGHGIGHNLCVHEGPQSIRMEDNPVAISPGMILSNEPAVYQEGKYGIRIENTLLCKELFDNEKGSFYGFETISFIPLDMKAVDIEMLSGDEVDWINRYHRDVYEKLSPYLDESLQDWLSKKTSNICD